MSLSAQQLSTLINAAKEHNIELSQDDLDTIKNALADSPLAQWVDNFPCSQSPNPEELRIWEYLRSGNHTLSRACVSDTEVLTESALRNAVSDLEASTRRLEAQAEALNAQHALINRHAKQTHQQRSQVTAHVNALHRKSTLQAQHVHFANEAKVSDLKSQLRARLEHLEKETKGVQLKVAKTLKGDDRSLGTLQKTINDGVGRFEQSSRPEHEQERVELLLKALKKARVEEIQDRLDRVYLQSLTGPPGAPDVNRDKREYDERPSVEHGQQPESKALISELQGEIESLYDEINDVATMLVDHEHGVPLRSTVADLSRAEEEGRNRVLSWAIQNITVMTEELGTLTRDVEEKRSERIVLATMLKEVGRIESEMSATGTKSRPTQIAAPEKQKALAELMKHLKLSQAGDLVRDSPQEGLETSREAFVHRLESAAQQRRAAVSLLTNVASPTTNVEDGLEALESRIAEARAELGG